MRKRFNAIMVAVAAVLLATTACQKEQGFELKSGKGVSVSIQGGIDDFTPEDDTKATIEQVVRVMWAENDVVYAYDANQKLGELKVHLKNEDKRYAYLTSDGTITEPTGSTITLVYASGCEPEFNGGKLTFDISDQNAAQTAFVLYGTLQYDGSGIIKDVFVPFHFATSVMKIHCTGLKAGSISWAAVYGVNSTCQLTLSSTGEPVVAGVNNGLIARSGADAFEASNDGRAAFTIAVVASPTSSARKIRVYKSNSKQYESAFTSGQIKTALSITSVYAFQERVQEYVEINGLRWAKENLAITPSGYKDFKGTGHFNGDYFQWATYSGYAGTPTDYDNGLLIYKSFTHEYCGDAVSAYKFKMNEDGSYKAFRNTDDVHCTPYAVTRYEFSQYKKAEETLANRDDAANIVLGGDWRIPTKDEFDAMKNVTYWEYDSTDKGYYVYNPRTNADKGQFNKHAGYNKADALLFFPQAGHGAGAELYQTEVCGAYWTSTLYSSEDFAYHFNINATSRSVDCNYRRYGNSIRPVCTITK